MFTILGTDGKEYGPVTAGKIMEWIRDGRANLQTKARREGETEWKALAEFAEFTPTHAAPPAMGAAPAPAAAPASAPVTPAGPVDAKAYAEELLARGGSVDVFGCLSQSFHLWTGNFLPLVGVTLLVGLAQAVIGMIPLLGMISGLFLNGVFYGGLYYYYLGKMRGEHREVGDAFAGFTKALVPLMLTSLLQAGLTIAMALMFFAPWIGFVIQVMRHPGAPGALPTLSPLLIGLGGIGALVMLFISISWIFSFVLVIDKGLGPWTALAVSWRVVTRNWFSVFFTVLLGAILMMLGLIGLFIGILFTIPLLIGATLYAYESLCNPPQVPAAPANPEQPLRG
ncbi:MAG: DUF4339 domain-containing protein [Opitutae bacterium]|nr:DUF4339 domain-containing protein [Opitutae bacterium]